MTIPDHGPIVRAVGPFTSRATGDIPFSLGRNLNHDPRSRAFPYRASAGPLAAVFHQRLVPIFDQGQLGDCTMCALLGALGTDPYFTLLRTAGLIDEMGNVLFGGDGITAQGSYSFSAETVETLYHDVTSIDPYDGTFPPDDTGSDGLSSAKVAVALGAASGYQHTFSLTDALAALQDYPLMVGTEWTNDMFNPDRQGRIKPSGQVAGGHEWIVDEYVPAGSLPVSGRGVLSATIPYIGGTTSWGTGFGAAGRFYMTDTNFGRLLAAEGDVIVLTPPTAPAPTPTPDPDPAPGAPTAQDVADNVRATLTALGL